MGVCEGFKIVRMWETRYNVLEPPCCPRCQLWWPESRQSLTHRKSPQPGGEVWRLILQGLSVFTLILKRLNSQLQSQILDWSNCRFILEKLTAMKPDASASSSPSCTWATKSPGPEIICQSYSQTVLRTSEPCLSVALGPRVASPSWAWDKRMNSVSAISLLGKRREWERMECRDA